MAQNFTWDSLKVFIHNIVTAKWPSVALTLVYSKCLNGEHLLCAVNITCRYITWTSL